MLYTYGCVRDNVILAAGFSGLCVGSVSVSSPGLCPSGPVDWTVGVSLGLSIGVSKVDGVASKTQCNH